MKPPINLLGEFAWSPFCSFTLWQCKLKYFIFRFWYCPRL